MFGNNRMFVDWYTHRRPCCFSRFAMSSAALIVAHESFADLPADVALYWADGTRTLAEILDLTELETHVRDPEGLVQYFELLARLELIELG